MDLQGFWDQIERTGEYKTPDRLNPRLSDRLLGRLVLWFYYRTFQTVWQSASDAKRGELTPRQVAVRGWQVWQAAEHFGIPITLEGVDRVVGKYDGPVVYAANHMSLFEITCIVFDLL